MALVDIEYVKSVAVEAGKQALQLAHDLNPEFKSDSSYVTIVDRQTEQFVQERLESRYPTFAFLGEEFGRHGDTSAPLWAVDPIDGTTNMVFGIPLWCVSIGLIDGGEPVAGALYLPKTDELFWGVKGEGSFRNGIRLKTRDRSSFHPEDTLGFTSAAVKNLNIRELTGRVRCLGSIATDIAYTASGQLCSMVGMYEGAYDMAAALCVAREAGCIDTYLDGTRFDMDQIVRDGKTPGAFVIAPPETNALVRKHLLG